MLHMESIETALPTHGAGRTSARQVRHARWCRVYQTLERCGLRIIRYLVVMLVWLARYPPHRLVARDRLFPRGTLVCQLGIDFFPER